MGSGRSGPVPNPNAVRNKLNPTPLLGKQELSGKPGEGRPLPDYLGVTTQGAKRFWETWAKAPQTEPWLETDWVELEAVTLLVDALHQGCTGVASEIRQRISRWGATVEDRARLRMTVEGLEASKKAQKAAGELSDDEVDEALVKLLSDA